MPSVPVPALQAWDALSDALRVHGPAPCEPLAEAWFAPDAELQKLAKGLCRDCPVQAECLAYALASDERFGIWGGLTREERARG